ncbi:MAG: ABC transporter permease [Eubacteriales bacterium]|nr:ABC transporter permease [Eubacteriales bacterium]
MQILITAMELGLIFGVMSMGIFITFKILNLPDLTIDGSYTLGAAVAAVITVQGHPYLGVLAAFACGALAGIITGLLHTKLHIDPILSGILTMTGLYSINLRIMGQRPTISIFGKKDIYEVFAPWLPATVLKPAVHVLFLFIIGFLLYRFLKTQIGISMIATGDNEEMVRASSINADAMKILGLAIGNALVAGAGAFMVSYTGFADINGGTGMMVIGIASIIVGATLLGESSIFVCFIGVVVGAVLYRYVLALALSIGLAAGDLKLLSSLLVVIAVGLPSVRKRMKGAR